MRWMTIRGIGSLAIGSMMRTSLCAALILVILTTCTACSSSGSAEDAPDGTMNQEQYRNAVAEGIGDYRWPAHYQPDAGKIANRGAEAGGLLQDGSTEMVLGILNECSWSLAWLDARESRDVAAEREALDVLTNVVPTLPGEFSGPDRRQAQRDRAAKASLGHPSGVQGFVTANCEPLYWTTTA